MKTKRVGRKSFPPLYIHPKNTLMFGFGNLSGMRRVKNLTEIPCQTDFFKFPTETEARRFQEGIEENPCHDGDRIGVARWKEYVIVADYDSETDRKSFKKCD